MAKVIDPSETKRAQAFEQWMKASMPMLTYSSTLDVSHLLSMKRRYKYKFNMLMCWCISRAAAMMEEFYMLPEKQDEENKLLFCDRLAITVSVKTLEGTVFNCDVPLSYDIEQFNREYLALTRHVQNSCTDYNIGEDHMLIRTVAFPEAEIDSVTAAYVANRNYPTLIWGKYRKGFFKTTLPVSFQFHHAQMDEVHAATFFALLQKEINKVTKPPVPKNGIPQIPNDPEE